jgi:hypothetical protein
VPVNRFPHNSHPAVGGFSAANIWTQENITNATAVNIHLRALAVPVFSELLIAGTIVFGNIILQTEFYDLFCINKKACEAIRRLSYIGLLEE